MNITKCDLCKKEVKGDTVVAGFGYFTKSRADLCKDCGLPIIKFLEKHKFLEKEKVKNG